MKSDLDHSEFRELLPKLIEMADTWSRWRPLLEEVDAKGENDVETLKYLFAVSETEDVWKLALSCAAYSLSMQRPGSYYVDRPDLTVSAVARALGHEHRELEGYEEIAKKMCKERYPYVVRVAPRLLEILKDIPVLPPITVLSPEFCLHTYGHDYRKFIECIRK